MIRQWLEEDKSKPPKQRHTKTRIFERLRDEYEFKGSRRAISGLVTAMIDKPAEVFCPIDHPPASEIQIDWGQAVVVLDNVQTKVMREDPLAPFWPEIEALLKQDAKLKLYSDN